MTIIKAISDTHNDHASIIDTECDILIHCGDFCTKGNHTEALNFLKWFVKQPAKYKVLVPGNHDVRFKTSEELQLLAHEYGIKVLMNSGVTIGSLKLWGGHFVPVVERVTSMVKNKESQLHAWDEMPKDLDILITHAPPKYILDLSQNNQHIGCEKLTEAIKNNSPKIHLFGHIHETIGESIQAYNTTFYNCVNKDRDYLTTKITPRVITIGDSK